MSLPEPWQRHAEIIGLRSVEAMWRDPFWNARYGERGRAYALQDAGFHLSWLAEAIHTNEPAFFSRYALWVRAVLTTRGMCTLHLSDQLRELGLVLEDLGLDPQGDARRVLEHAQAGLRYTEGEAGALDSVADTLAREVAQQVGGSELDLRHHLSYLADALSHGRPELMQAHLAFVRARPDSQRAPEQPLEPWLRAMSQALERRQLQAAQQMLASPP